jgi:hypothetical protein
VLIYALSACVLQEKFAIDLTTAGDELLDEDSDSAHGFADRNDDEKMGAAKILGHCLSYLGPSGRKISLRQGHNICTNPKLIECSFTFNVCCYPAIDCTTG